MSSTPNQSTEAVRQELIAEVRRIAFEELTMPGPGDQYSSTALLVANRGRKEWEAVAVRWREKNRELEAENKELRQRVYELEKRNTLRRRAGQTVLPRL